MDTTTSSTTTPQEEEGSENLESLKGGLRFSALDLAPDFTLLDEYKNPVSLHDYRGKHVLVRRKREGRKVVKLVLVHLTIAVIQLSSS